jgi:hypothetical protein
MLRRLIALLAVCSLASAVEVELTLTSGRTVRGEVISETDGGLTLRMRTQARGGIQAVDVAYQKADILRRKELPSLDQQYAERKERTPDTVPEQCGLAQWCYENSLREKARDHAKHVLESDSTNAWARRILDKCGYVEVEGAWVDEGEYAKANGVVRIDGQFIPVAVAEGRRVLGRAVAARDALAKKIADMRDQVENKPKAAEEADAKMKSGTAAAEAAKKDIEVAEEQLAALREETPKGEASRDRQQKKIDELTKRIAELKVKQRDAKRTADDAKRAADLARSAGERVQTELPKLEAALTKAEAEVAAAIAKLPADDPVAKAAIAPSPAKEDATDAKQAKGAKPSDKAGDEQPAEDKPAEDKPAERRLRRGAD